MAEKYTKVEIENELESLREKFNKVEQNMIAIAMDYKHYIKSTIDNYDIYEIRDSISYRLRATDLHLRILSSLLDSLDEELTNLHIESLKEPSKKPHLQIHFFQREKDISALFDSIIFHIISAFDYVGNLVGFIILDKKKLKWTSLAKSSRDSKNEIGNSMIGELIDTIDRKFAGRLYDHRSYLIHISNEKNKMSFSINLSKGIVTSQIEISNRFVKNFSYLREISKSSEISLSFALFWLLNETVDNIIKLQFGMKNYMEKNRKVEIPMFFLKGKNGEMLPTSSRYWIK